MINFLKWIFNKNNQIFFAGESTNYKHIGTVSGAYMTGRRAASDLVKSIQK